MRILFLAQFPPPIHGPSQMSKLLLEAIKSEKSFNCDYLNISTAKNLENIGHFELIKPLKLFINFIKFINLLINKKYDIFYISMGI